MDPLEKRRRSLVEQLIAEDENVIPNDEKNIVGELEYIVVDPAFSKA